MKYLIKFNESSQESVLTKELFEKIENLFLDWEFDVIPVDVEQQLPIWSRNAVGDLRDYFFYFYIYPLSDKGPLKSMTCEYGEIWWKLDEESLEEIGAFVTTRRSVLDAALVGSSTTAQINYPRKNYFEFEKMSDIDKLFKSDPTSPNYCQLFRFLDRHYDLHESLKGLMYRTKGIKHYGFDFKYSLSYEFDKHISRLTLHTKIFILPIGQNYVVPHWKK